MVGDGVLDGCGVIVGEDVNGAATVGATVGLPETLMSSIFKALYQKSWSSSFVAFMRSRSPDFSPVPAFNLLSTALPPITSRDAAIGSRLRRAADFASLELIAKAQRTIAKCCMFVA